MTDPEVSKKDNFEDFLLSNQFYVGPSNSQNHLTNFRKSIQIPNSMSNTSIHAGLANDMGANASQQRTSIMKISPSMKALESILSEKTNSGSVRAPERIMEEDEDRVHVPQGSGLSVNYTTDDPNRGSTYSVQTFETAHSDNSFSDTINMNMNESPHKSLKSMSTIDDGYNTNDDTPVLINPAQFQTFTQVNGSSKNSMHPIRVVNESPVEDLGEQSTDVSNGTIDNKDIEPDDTLVGNEGVLKNQYEQQQKLQQKQQELFEEQRIQKELQLKQREIQILKNQMNAQEQKKQKELLQLEQLKQQEKQENETKNVVSSLLLPNTGKVVEKPSAEQSMSSSKPTNNATPKPEPLKKSPHTRSNSTFSLSFTKNKEQPPLPGKTKRSSTFGDLSAISNNTEKSRTAKKFSFKNLFKSKPKATKSQDDELVSKPKKLSSRSYSTPNFASFNNNANTVEEEKKISDSKNKTNERVKLSLSTKQHPLPQPPQQETPGHKPSMPSSASLLSVFKKDKQTDNSLKLIVSDNQEQVSKKTKRNEIEDEEYNREPSLMNKKPFNPNHSSNMNFIREVNDDDDYNPRTKYPTPEITESDFEDINDNERNNYYNNDNDIIKNQMSQSLNAEEEDVGNELANTNENDSLLNNGSLFGSPFKVDYKPSEHIPRLEHSHEKSTNLNEDEKPNVQKEVNDQLLGETLFPKSLSVQEVESIVSLERSRSMRSIKSNKRNSFVNYDGSDENVIQYDGTRSNTPNLDSNNISRSNSILKKSSSKRSLKVDNMKSINAQMLKDEPTENYDDLIEFTDYIDFDNLDFSISPKEIVERSPVLMQLSPTIVSDKFNQQQQVTLNFSRYGTVENQAEGISDREHETSSIQEILPPPEYLKPEYLKPQNPAIILNTPPPSQDNDPKQQMIIPQIVDEQDKIPLEEMKTDEHVQGPLTPNLEIINASQISESPVAINELPESDNRIEKSPIMGTAFKNTPVNENGNIMNNRPISMSFRGLKGPSFGGKLAMHDLRSSDSHQSFNMSFVDEDDLEEDCHEAPVSEVGRGFGSSDDEDEDYYDKFENKENQYRSPVVGYQQNSSKFDQENNLSPLPPPNSLPTFNHNKIPLISSNNSSPKSFSSMFSRKFKKSPAMPSSTRAVDKDGVRFSSRIILYDTYNCEEYDRHPDNATCNQLTPTLAQQIKDELNEFKSEMSIHEHSRCHTHFF